MSDDAFGTLKKMDAFCEIRRDLGTRADGFRWLEAVSENGSQFLIRAPKDERHEEGERTVFSGYGARLPLLGKDGGRARKTEWKTVLLSGVGDALPGDCGKGRIASVIHDGGDGLSYVGVRPDRRKNGLLFLIRRFPKPPEPGDAVDFSGPVVSFPSGDGMLSFMPACDDRPAAGIGEKAYAGECLSKLANGGLDYADIDFSRIRGHSQLLSLAMRAVSGNAWNIRLLDKDEFTDSEYADICMNARHEREGLLLMDAVKFAKGSSIGDYIAICADLLKSGEPAEWIEENIEWGLLTKRQAAELRECAGSRQLPKAVPKPS